MRVGTKILICTVTFFITIATLHIGGDVIKFNRVVSSSYKTPWFDNDYLKEPYTTFMLRDAKNKEYWTKNVVGDDWYVRDVYYKDSVFWTILKKNKKPSIQ